MWIDTGARPDTATFMLTSSVFRGISMEGGCYPRGGSDKMAAELVPVIESFGGRVLIRAQVEQVLVESKCYCYNDCYSYFILTYTNNMYYYLLHI
jgi:all-trans-retinol 13,14-reductase